MASGRQPAVMPDLEANDNSGGHASAAGGDPNTAGRVAHPAPPSPMPAYHPPAPPPPLPSRGLSVAEATEAAQIAFRPLRRGPDQPPYRTDYHRESSQAAPDGGAVAQSETQPRIEPSGKAQPPAASAERDANASAIKVENQRRFGRTLAELERLRAISRALPRPAAAAPSALPHEVSSKPAGDHPERWSSVVPRPAGAQTADREAGSSKSAWTRLWRRRKATDPD